MLSVDKHGMEIRVQYGARSRGYTLIELMLTVAILGTLAAIAIPILTSYQLRSKSAEGKVNLGAIRVLEQGFFSEYEVYRSANAEPAALPGSVAAHFDGTGSDFGPLGFVPEGRVYFSYGVAINDGGSAFTADAGADIDADGFVQYWGYASPDGDGSKVAGKVGCNVAGLIPESIGPCTPGSGRSVF